MYFKIKKSLISVPEDPAFSTRGLGQLLKEVSFELDELIADTKTNLKSPSILLLS